MKRLTRGKRAKVKTSVEHLKWLLALSRCSGNEHPLPNTSIATDPRAWGCLGTVAVPLVGRAL